MVRYSFPVRLFHSLLHAGLSRRSDATRYYFGLASVFCFGRPIDIGCSRRPRRASSAAINFLFPAGRLVRVRIRIVASVFYDGGHGRPLSRDEVAIDDGNGQDGPGRGAKFHSLHPTICEQ